ncbi:MAG: hypothetical protein E7453_06225 [Ruminococcaceae bacterium]|nr:hypothetical protein [Oscillospiraceae bacterium]
MDIYEFQRRINEYIARRERLDPAAVYEQLKDVYPVVLNMEPAYDYEIPVLSGESSAGKFELYDNGLDIIFDIYNPDGNYTHWHPESVAEAIEAVRKFMNGACEH